MQIRKEFQVNASKEKLKNNTHVCIGTGRMFLALHKEYHDQLKKVQEEIGFSYIRGHGLFHDDMGIYNEYEEDGEYKVEYNFTYVDRVFDDYLSLGIKPFVELGFMPGQLASGKETVFYWKGNITPPKDYKKWTDLVQATISHWIGRYSIDEVRTWFFEVWNEPNLTSFWKDANEQEYFKLYEETAAAVKEIDKELRVGGPAICGVDDERWLKEFLTFCSEHNCHLDFVSRHLYTVEKPRINGHYAYQDLREHNIPFGELKVSREIIDSFECYRNMDMHITEYNTSYVPNCPLHDGVLNAAYIAKLLSRMGETSASYSYWTFGDVFEEKGIPFTSFSGGFGLLANGNIPKPTYWVFQFYKRLGEINIDTHEYGIVSKKAENNICGVIWNPILEEDGESSVQLTYLLNDMADGEYFMMKESISEKHGNPRETWHHMGKPASPSKEQTEILRSMAHPYKETKKFNVADGQLFIDFSLEENEVIYFELEKIDNQNDRGYEY